MWPACKPWVHLITAGKVADLAEQYGIQFGARSMPYIHDSQPFSRYLSQFVLKRYECARGPLKLLDKQLTAEHAQSFPRECGLRLRMRWTSQKRKRGSPQKPTRRREDWNTSAVLDCIKGTQIEKQARFSDLHVCMSAYGGVRRITVWDCRGVHKSK